MSSILLFAAQQRLIYNRFQVMDYQKPSEQSPFGLTSDAIVEYQRYQPCLAVMIQAVENFQQYAQRPLSQIPDQYRIDYELIPDKGAGYDAIQITASHLQNGSAYNTTGMVFDSQTVYNTPQTVLQKLWYRVLKYVVSDAELPSL